MDYKKIGHRIELRRKELELTLADLAAEVDLSASTIQRYEKGRFDKIKMPIIEAIAEALCVNPDWLMCLTDDPTDYDDGVLLAEIPLSYVEACDGDMKRAYAMMKAVDDDYFKECALSKVASHNFQDMPPLSDEAMELARAYDKQLDTWGRKLVRAVMEQALARQTAETEIILDRDVVRLPLAIQTMGVGIAIPFTELSFETILVEKNEITSKACFAVRVRGNATSCWTDSDILLFEKSMSSTIGAFVIDGLFQILDQEGDKMHLPGSTDTVITMTKNIQRKGYLFNYLNPKWVLGNKKVFPEGYNGPYDMSKL